MNLAFICTEKLPAPAVKGGAIQLMLDGISPYFSENYRVTVYSITDPLLPEKNRENGITYIRFPRAGFSENVALNLKEKSFTHIHIFNRPSEVCRYKKASPDSKIILSLHNDMFTTRKLSREEACEVIDHCDSITTVSEYIKRTVTVRYPQAEPKTHVVYSGVDITKFHPPWSVKGQEIRAELRKKYGLEQHHKVILFIGRLSKTKGPDLLIRSMYEIIRHEPDAVLVIVGGKWFSENGMNDYVRHLYEIAEPIKHNVHFTKYIPSPEIPNILLMGDLLVCSSQWHEPLARIHYEAMAAGLPILTTDRGGNAEVIFNDVNGCVIKEYDQKEAFVSFITRLLQNTSLSENFAKNGRNMVEEKFSFIHTAKKLEQIYLKS
ncbi:glycosyltransferase family 4 protein [Metabacillus idriensis]|uniref:glycosyltransferase family 4 protein n=1 Tax=Metabacillus idriensis TaxID=324768 RepID=UPI003D29D349